jgi:hypothetical protein
MKECIRSLTPCPFRVGEMCNIVGKDDYFCLDEEEYMSDALENQERMQKRGIRDIKMLEGHIKSLSDYCEICQSAEVLDRVMDAIKELRKARVKLAERNQIDFEVNGEGA